LDTVEDDMTISNDVKLPLLTAFYEKLDEPQWTFNGSGENEKDRDVLVKFNLIIDEFQRLEPG
jgi:farnesyl-diphosphate farnesyltransferase